MNALFEEFDLLSKRCKPRVLAVLNRYLFAMDVETTKRKRISKKRKSAWRKTDIRDVEEFLELQREDEIIG